MLKRYAELAADAAVAYAAYRLFGWIGFAVWSLFVISRFLADFVSHQHVIETTLLSRLPDRCAFCHREIVDEGGTFDEHGIYHEACIEKLESLEALRKEAGVPLSEAIHRLKWRSRETQRESKTDARNE
jgi:hypothetical protein